MSAEQRALPLREGLPVWSAIAAESFGGPVAQIAVLHRVLVSERRWISEERFQRALSFCMLLPGPEAQQLATYIGWQLHGTRGAIVAGSLFVLPGFLALLALSLVYVYGGDTSAVAGVLAGIRPIVVAIVAHALPRLARHVLRDRLRIVLALGAFLGMYFLRLPFPLVLAVAAVVGALRYGESTRQQTQPRVRYSVRTLAIWLGIWLMPLAVAWATLGSAHILVQEGRFFATSALVTFGGAYAVLSYVAQEAVHRFHWLSPAEMVTGLGLAESTPGPLIQVVQFVAFLGAFRAATPLEPLTAGILASLLVTWLTFVPSFLFILTLGPYVERLAHNAWLLGALQGIAAAVLGAMLNLAIWFALHTLFVSVVDVQFGAMHFSAPVLATIDWIAVGVAVLAFVALTRRMKHSWLLLGGAALGLLRSVL